MSRPPYLALACLISALGLLAAPSFAAAAGDLTPNPTQLDLGTQGIHQGSTPSQSVKFENLTGGDLSVTSVSVVGTDAASFTSNNDCSFVMDGTSCGVSVAFNPTTPGPKSAQIELVDDNGTVIVPLSATGATGTLSGSSPSFDPQPYFFGGQERDANISNLSAFAVASTNATIAGPDAASFSIGFNGCQFVLNPGNNCNVGVNFNPSSAGAYNAQLELSNDGTDNPLVILLSATALAGPDAVISPAQAGFGDVAIGSASASRAFTIENAGDYPLQIQQVFVLSGTPQLFPISVNSCSAHVLSPAASCQLSVEFHPTGTGEREGTVFVITNENGPVETASFFGYGVASPNGAATVAGAAAAGSPLTCAPSGYSDGTTFAYQWQKDGNPFDETGPKVTPTDADVGARFSCRVSATNSVGSQTVDSAKSAPIAPKDLSGLDGSLVDESVCRASQAPPGLKVGTKTVKLSYGKPVTPSSTFVLDAPGLKMTAMIDGQALARGTGHLALTPRALQSFANGTHTLRVSAGSREGSSQIALAPCHLAVRLEGGPSRPSSLVLSAAAGMTSPKVSLPGKLRLHVSATALGIASIQVAGNPPRPSGSAERIPAPMELPSR
ncbi:MAG TPA: choice-of-anchor D domain-containing protein [Solirubrobacterales bacterium]|jgi:hypothetical protein